MKINKFLVQKSRTGLLPKCVVTHSVCCDLDVLWCWALAGRWLSEQGAREARRRGPGHAGGKLGAQAGRWARGKQARGRQATVCGAHGACAAGARQAPGLGAGRAGWPWAVHSVHSAHFRSVLTRFFPESLNEHCSL